MDGGDWLALLAGVGLTATVIVIAQARQRPYTGVRRHTRCAGCGLPLQVNEDGTVIAHAFGVGETERCSGSGQVPLGPQTVTLTFDYDDWEDIEHVSWEAKFFRTGGQAQTTMQLFLDQVAAARSAQAPPPPPSPFDDEDDDWPSPDTDQPARRDRRRRR